MATKYEYLSSGAAYGAVWVSGWKPPPIIWSGSNPYYQTFTPSTAHIIEYVKLKLYKEGTPYQVKVTICPIVGGYADLSNPLCTGYLDCSSVTTDTAGAWYTINFSPGAALSASTTYAISISLPEIFATGNKIYIIHVTTNDYSGGTCYRHQIPTDVDQGWDLLFEDWGTAFTNSVNLPLLTADAKIRQSSIQHGHNVSLPCLAADAVANLLSYNLPITLPLLTASANILKVDPVRLLKHSIEFKPDYSQNPAVINRVYVIGTDENGNMVYGEDKDVTINGEQLIFLPDSIIPDQESANTIAANLRAKVRLHIDYGFVPLASPNCGSEVWDPISITEEMCNQSGNKYRVAGWDDIFDAKRGDWYQDLHLAGV